MAHAVLAATDEALRPSAGNAAANPNLITGGV